MSANSSPGCIGAATFLKAPWLLPTSNLNYPYPLFNSISHAHAELAFFCFLASVPMRSHSLVHYWSPLPWPSSHRRTLPLPEDPSPAAPELPFVRKSCDIQKTGFGAGGLVEEDPHMVDMREPVVKQSRVRIDLEECHKEVNPTQEGVA